MTSIHSVFVVGSTYRAVRYFIFVLVVWLLTPWWGRRDMLLLRCHRLCLAVVLGSVVLGAALSPGAALGSGRLSGVVWPVPPPQVAHYAATMFGTTVLLWMCKVITRSARWPPRGRDRSGAGGHAHPDRSDRSLRRPSGGRSFALPGKLAGPAYGGHLRRDRTADRRRLRQRGADVGSTWPGQLPGERSDGADQGLVRRDGAASHDARALVRVRDVEHVVQRTADRQQLGGHLSGSRVVRRRPGRLIFSSFSSPRSAAPGGRTRRSASSSSCTASSPPSPRRDWTGLRPI